MSERRNVRHIIARGKGTTKVVTKEEKWNNTYNKGIPGAKYANVDIDKLTAKNKQVVKRKLPHDDISRLAPGYYQVYKSKEGVYSVELQYINRPTPVNIFGKTGSRVIRYWKKYVKYPSSAGVMLVGSAGGGKTLEADILVNVCINNGNLPVLSMTGFKADEGVIAWLEEVTELAIYMDEFAKHFNRDVQELMLPMFTDKSKKFFFILTDNDVHTFSRFLRSRPGRLWYRKAFDKLEEDVVLEVLEIYSDMREEFREEFLRAYRAATTFTFDHLITIIKEHFDYPDESLEEMLEIVNIDDLSKPKMYYLVRAEKLIEGKKFDIDDPDVFEDIAFVGQEVTKARFEQTYFENAANVYLENPLDEKDEKAKKKAEEKADELASDNATPSFFRRMNKPKNNSGTKNLSFNFNNIAHREAAEYKIKVDNYVLTFEIADIGTYPKTGILFERQY